MSPENNLRNKEATVRKMYESSELLKSVLGKMPNWFIYPIRNLLIPTSTKYTLKDSSSSYISHISLRVGIGPLGSLHHSDSLFPKNLFFPCFEHFKITVH